MKFKLLLASIICVLLLTGCNNTTTQQTTNGTTGQTTVVTTEVNKPNYVNTLIVLPTEAYDETEAINMINRLSSISEPILNELINKGVKIKLSTTNITGVPEYAHLAGVTPRGWPSNMTWDDVPGIGGNPVVARIGYSDYGKGHTSVNLELHETAHAIDTYVFNRISYSEEFKQLQTNEKNALFGSNAYFNYPEEYFAETFAMYYLGNQDLKTKAPQTYEFIKNLNTKIIQG